MVPTIIYQDKDFLAINKPAGLLVHKVKDKEGGATLADWLVSRFPGMAAVGDDPELRPGIVHRLDKGTSGVMIVAKNQKAFDHLKGLFQRREVKKEYLAVAKGLTPEKGMIDAPIGILPGTVRRSLHSSRMAKSAVTEYFRIKIFKEDGKDYSVIKVLPKTGRTHQIRVHLASIGHPIAGDRLYGGKNQPVWAKRALLHAKSIEFVSPNGEILRIEADPPEDFPRI